MTAEQMAAGGGVSMRVGASVAATPPPCNAKSGSQRAIAMRGRLFQEDLAGLGTITGADDAALFEDVDHARGTGVA